MATETAVAGRAEPKARTKTKKPKAQGGTPWWLWLAVAAIVIFCVFPFYWLSTLSLKTGAGGAIVFDPTLANQPVTIGGLSSIVSGVDTGIAYTGPDRVRAGSTVTVMNMDNQAHTVTADDGSFDAVVKAGASTTFTAPAKPGTYTYHCT